MDTKSRSIRYSWGMKALAVIIAWLSFVSICGSGFFLLNYRQYVSAKSYYETRDFAAEFSMLAEDAATLIIELKSEENIKASKASAGAISENLARFDYLKNKLAGTVNFAYCFKNTDTGETITNVQGADPIAAMRKQKAFEHYSHSSGAETGRYTYYSNLQQIIGFTSYDLYVAVVEPLRPGDVFYDGYQQYQRMKTVSTNLELLLGASLALLVITAVYLIYAAGRKEKDGEIVLSFIDKVYSDVQTLFVLIAAYFSFLVVVNVFQPEIFAWLTILTIASIDAFIGMTYVLSMVRQIKSGIILKNTLIFRACEALGKLIRLCLSGKMFKPWILLLLLGYGFINGILFTLGTHIREDYQILIVFTAFLAFNSAAVYFGAKALTSLTQIMEGVREISNGNVDYSMDSALISPVFAGFAGNIQSIQGGLKKAVAEAVKGERMKTDLIANVSHDLKTPLTSIINYVDLLKKEELNNSNADGYVVILEEKSARLKQLIEDLIEASKASSGNLAVSIERVDLHELVMQALGEFEEKLEKVSLDVRINTNDKSALVFADGKCLWRVLENLLSNTVKYSMPGSRVYVNIDRNSGYGILTIKNISAFQLDISPEQLTERFVRGDESRTTEGSGLGLSIAKSLTELQGGSFSIDIDGDLFKVTVKMPLWDK